MSDWADELATKLWQSPGGNKRLRACIAKALRDVQRETAEECCEVATRAEVARRGAADAIKARFGLDKEGR